MDKEEIKSLLREEAEKIDSKINNIEVKMTNIFNKTGISSLDKINKLQREKELLHAQSFKLYEMLGRIS